MNLCWMKNLWWTYIQSTEKKIHLMNISHFYFNKRAAIPFEELWWKMIKWYYLIFFGQSCYTPLDVKIAKHINFAAILQKKLQQHCLWNWDNLVRHLLTISSAWEASTCKWDDCKANMGKMAHIASLQVCMHFDYFSHWWRYDITSAHRKTWSNHDFAWESMHW